MKKIFIIILFFILVGYFYNSYNENLKIEQKKQELLSNNNLEKNSENIKKIKQEEKAEEKKEEKNQELKSEDSYNLDKITYEKKLIGTENNGIFLGMPEGPLWGKALSNGDGKITYSKIENLLIEKKDFDKNLVSSSKNIWNNSGTGYLNTNYNSYIYWNTLREIDSNNKDLGTSFYILEKKDDKIVYEKLYFDFKHSLIGLLKIEEFNINKNKDIGEQMSELNKKLKQKKDNLKIVKDTDFLFKEIVR